jgi:hypothetical protein
MTWFPHRNFTSLVINQHHTIADHRIINSLTISDAKLIQALMDSIEKIPANGDMMISFASDAEHITLNFYEDGKIHQLDIISRRFKTPSTGFNNRNDHEAELYKYIEALLKG